jgi:tRNA(fMet)-specific endonuclease VapC
MIRYILDTDHLSLAQRKHPIVTAKILAMPKDSMAITIITVEEQLRGRFSQIRRFPSGPGCINAYFNLRETVDDLRTKIILDFDLVAEAIDQSLIKQKLRLGTQDRRIAAIALANRCTLVTANTQDFSKAPGLILEDWTR